MALLHTAERLRRQRRRVWRVPYFRDGRTPAELLASGTFSARDVHREQHETLAPSWLRERHWVRSPTVI